MPPDPTPPADQKPAADNVLIDSVFKMTTKKLVIRVWRRESEVRWSYDNTDLALAVNKTPEKDHNPAHLAVLLQSMPRVSAVEVLWAEHGVGGDGIIIHTRDSDG